MRTREYRRERNLTKYVSKLKKLFKSGVRRIWIDRKRDSFSYIAEAETWEDLGIPSNRLYRYKSTRTIWEDDGYKKWIRDYKDKQYKQAAKQELKEYFEEQCGT